jgi:hypothetical protein
LAGGLEAAINDSKPCLFDAASVLTYPSSVFAQIDCSGNQELDVQMKKASHDIKDIKARVISAHSWPKRHQEPGSISLETHG